MAGDNVTASGWAPPRQWRLMALLFAGICATLALGYYLFLRPDYTVLYSGLRPADAAAIVAQLDSKGIAHRLRDGGTTILVPADQADTGHLAIAGSEVGAKGAVGFELFNKSDMGLTDFAQKINYQRALQGELARTIMAMEGVESARVHLAIPERSLFRTNRSEPKAAVEVVAKLGQTLTADRIAGIQQLVASSVPDLALGAVVVIDGDGRVVSAAPPSPANLAPEVEEQTAAQNYYSARARAALAAAMPGVQAEIHTLILPGAEGSTDAAVAGGGAVPPVAPNGTGARSFRLRITVATAAALGTDDQTIARGAIVSAAGLDLAHGDELSFQVGMAPSQPATALVPAALPAPASTALPPARIVTPGWSLSWWQPLLGAAFLVAVALLLRTRRPGPTAEQALFVERLRAQLGRIEVEDARA